MRKQNILCMLFLLPAVLTACGQKQGSSEPVVQEKAETVQAEESTAAALDVGSDAASDAEAVQDPRFMVSTAAELISSISPDAHIILKSGTYNFSALTREEIDACGAYVDKDGLIQGEFSVYNAPGLILEAEERGTVRLVTENGYAEVVTLSYCDGAQLKGVILGHEIEKGECDADVLKLATSQSVTIEDCGLFGCGSYGIQAENSSGLSVTGTEIYECTNGILFMNDTEDAVFERCRFYDNAGMFFLWGDTDVRIRNSEISRNEGTLMYAGSSTCDEPDTMVLRFQGCTFQDNPDMGAPEDWPGAAFEDCRIK